MWKRFCSDTHGNISLSTLGVFYFNILRLFPFFRLSHLLIGVPFLGRRALLRGLLLLGKIHWPRPHPLHRRCCCCCCCCSWWRVMCAWRRQRLFFPLRLVLFAGTHILLSIYALARALFLDLRLEWMLSVYRMRQSFIVFDGGLFLARGVGGGLLQSVER